MYLNLRHNPELYVGSIKTQFYSNRRDFLGNDELGEQGNGVTCMDMERYELMTLSIKVPKTDKDKNKEKRVEVLNCRGRHIGYTRKARKETKTVQVYHGDQGASAELLKKHLFQTCDLKFNAFCSDKAWTAERVFIYVNVFAKRLEDKYKVFDELKNYLSITDRSSELKIAYQLESRVRCIKVYRTKFHAHNIKDPFNKLPTIKTSNYKKISKSTSWRYD